MLLRDGRYRDVPVRHAATRRDVLQHLHRAVELLGRTGGRGTSGCLFRYPKIGAIHRDHRSATRTSTTSITTNGRPCWHGLAPAQGGEVGEPGHISFVRPSTTSYAADQLRGDPRDFRIPRTSDRDLAFRGWPLSHAEERGGPPGALRGVDIDIYMTIGLRLVGHVCHWTLEEGRGFKEEHHVAVHDTAADLIEWLKRDN